jgi:LAO/AO transport system kinase
MDSLSSKKILAGDVRTISRALSLIEQQGGRRARELLKDLYPHSSGALIVGITGSMGAGKSTLTRGLAEEFLEQGLKVAVVAVDPTSPFSGGAILGDRIRMQNLATNRNVFIRSMATRGRLGGLSAAVNDSLIILAAAGYKMILVETVGVGQDEIEIARTADVTVVVLTPGMGDDVQTLKAGILEIADIFVLNKADREGADKTKSELEALQSLLAPEHGWLPPLLETVATERKGIGDLASSVLQFRSVVLEPGLVAQKRVEMCRARLVDMLRDRLLEQVLATTSSKKLDDLAAQIAVRKLDPHTAVDELERLNEPS